MGQTAFAAFLFLFCFTIAFPSLSLTASLYICFHNTLQIAVFNNVSLELFYMLLVHQLLKPGIGVLC